jgi:hypothetical protein
MLPGTGRIDARKQDRVGRLSKRMVEAGEVRPSEHVLWGGDIPRFGLRVIPPGRKGYLIQYRVGTRSRKLALGPHGVLTVDQARAGAIQALADVKGGGDPAEARKERHEAITVRELPERFDREHIAMRVKESLRSIGSKSFRMRHSASVRSPRLKPVFKGQLSISQSARRQ